jgi:hypothetical protein
MIYYLGKAFWVFAAPTSALILMSASAGLFAVVGNSPWAAWLAGTAACGLVIAAFTPIGLALCAGLGRRARTWPTDLPTLGSMPRALI